MATGDINPRINPASEPELDFLLSKSTFEEPLWKSLFRNLDDFLFPKKQPPLVLTSKPVPVKDIWGFYDYKKNGVLGSAVLHVVALAVIIGGTILAGKMVKAVVKPQETVTLVAPDDIPALPPSKTQAGGGGGGGDRDKLQAPKGKLPKFSMERSRLQRWSCAIRIPNWPWNPQWSFLLRSSWRNRTSPTWVIPCHICLPVRRRTEQDLVA